MGVTYVSKSPLATVAGRSDSLTIDKPSGVTANSTLIAVLAGVGFLVPSPPDGWEEGSPNPGSFMIFGRKATGSEPDSYTFEWPSVGFPGTEVYHPSGIILNYTGGSREDTNPRSSYGSGDASTNPIETGFINSSGIDSDFLIVGAWALSMDAYPFSENPFPPESYFSPVEDTWTVRHDDDSFWGITVADSPSISDIFFKGHANNPEVGTVLPMDFSAEITIWGIGGAALVIFGREVPKLRQRQRDDGARVRGAARNAPSSRQSSVRRGWANTYV